MSVTNDPTPEQSPARTPIRRLPSGFATLRDAATFLIGMAIIVNEVFLSSSVEPAAVALGVTMTGLPWCSGPTNGAATTPPSRGTAGDGRVTVPRFLRLYAITSVYLVVMVTVIVVLLVVDIKAKPAPHTHAPDTGSCTAAVPDGRNTL